MGKCTSKNNQEVRDEIEGAQGPYQVKGDDVFDHAKGHKNLLLKEALHIRAAKYMCINYNYCCTCMVIIMILVNMLQVSCTAVHWAALYGYQEVVEVLVSHGANTQLQDKVGVVNISMCGLLCSTVHVVVKYMLCGEVKFS